MLSILSSPKHLIYAPLYLQQGKQVKRDTLRLLEAIPLKKKERRGIFPFVRNRNNHDKQVVATPQTDSLTNHNLLKHEVSTPCYHLMVAGDSSSAGVGVDYQSQALIGNLLLSLYHDDEFSQKYSSIDWQLHATTGHDSFDVLRRLYLLPSTEQPLDLLVLVVGVNDANKMQSQKKWLNNLKEIITIAQHKFKPKNIIFTALPPMEYFPALPYPLSQLMGDKARQLNQDLQGFCADFPHIHYASFDIPFGNNVNNTSEYFASDGFHPNGLTYRIWAEQLAIFISRLSCN